MDRHDLLIIASIATLASILLMKRWNEFLTSFSSISEEIGLPTELAVALLFAAISLPALLKLRGSRAEGILIDGRRYCIKAFRLEIERDGLEIDVNKMRDIASSIGVGLGMIIASSPSRGVMGTLFPARGGIAVVLWRPGADKVDESKLSATASALKSLLEGVRLLEIRDPKLARRLAEAAIKSSSLTTLGESRISTNLPSTKIEEIPLVELGLSDGRTAGIPLRELAKHVLVVGQTGSGKTTTVKRIIRELWDWGVPTLVIDVHWEYRNLIFQMGGRIFSPEEPFPGLCINPLSSIHEDENFFFVLETLSSLLDLTPSQFYLLSRALKILRDSHGVGKPPTFKDLFQVIREFGAGSMAEEESRASLLRKLEPLMLPEAQALLHCGSGDIHRSLDTPTVIELGSVGSDLIRRVFVFFLLREIQRIFLKGNLKPKYPLLALVLEEADKILPHFKDPAGRDLVERMFSEMRKFGLVLILISQSTKDIPEGVIANTGVKLIHRISSSSDIKAVRELSKGRKEVVEAATMLADGEAMLVLPYSLKKVRVVPAEEDQIPDEAVRRAVSYIPFYWG